MIPIPHTSTQNNTSVQLYQPCIVSGGADARVDKKGRELNSVLTSLDDPNSCVLRVRTSACLFIVLAARTCSRCISLSACRHNIGGTPAIHTSATAQALKTLEGRRKNDAGKYGRHCTQRSASRDTQQQNNGTMPSARSKIGQHLRL